ncbi:MAG: NAD(P)H-quinone oxidoreductase [bacterium]|nr:NAD(P)H-quinone oxidoreductase [bacterium]
MKAMLVTGEENLVWSEVPDPVPAAGEALVEIHAAGVNRADILQRRGTYPSPKGCPPWMGLEVAGVVTALGEGVSRFRAGDRVCALLGGGGYAEKVCVPEGMLMPIPQGLSFETAAALPEAYATCYLNLFYEGGLRPGETLFFPAGASGLASVGIPMAKAFGAYVITSVLSTEKKAQIAHLHADVVIDSSREDAAEVLAAQAGEGHPVDVAVDCLGGETIARALPNVNEGCRWVLISTLDGVTATIPLRALLTRGVMLKGSMLRKRSVREKTELLARLVRDVWPRIESGEIVPTVCRVFPIEEARRAHELLERGENTGKVVLKVR